jgi:cysteine desulfurase/selenocysteine lyase
MDAVEAYVDELARYAVDRIRAIPSLMVYGPSDGEPRGAAITFAVPGLEAHALSRLLANRFGILVRSGFHCAQPAHEAIKSPPTVRASFYVYNTREEIDCLADALSGIVRHLA